MSFPMMPKTTSSDILLYIFLWLIIFIASLFWYFIICGFRSKKDFVFASIFGSIIYIIGVLCL